MRVSDPLVFDPLAGLMTKASRGDRAAAAALVEAVSPRLWRISWRLLRDAAEAEDVTQEALIRLWKILPSWQTGRARIETWLHQVTTNLCFDRLRKAGRFVEEGTAPEPTDPGPMPDTGMQQQAVRDRIDAALAALPDRQRAALVLTHFEELAAKDVGDILGVSVDAVESLLARGRRALRVALAAERADLLNSSVEGHAACL
ncbi:ECF RNA polymerase sigma factor SigW [Candidatus Phycosocius bacilliformis]|uniref:ECF RNA polymerase sigma factor SigW n=2 Tax=Candidatus Phycosocius bacilliformis TaxID=1445552 RepID=A0A2P2EAX7_9PROT|nr:ECF RNA polymerase sigma factor SigW [Candidatus Phycosocius bacilliformis]